MSSFRFNFCGHDENDIRTAASKESIQWLESEKVLADKYLKIIDDENIRAKMFVCGEVEIGHVIVHTALANIKESGFNNVELAEKAHSDLVAGSYEGGLKIWECTYDMIQLLEELNINFENKNVLDLGCGAGILGIYALMKGSHITFQDYNKEVLEHVTIPNVLLNIENDREENLKKCQFYSGDWESFNIKLPKTDVYDIILSSETIYNESNYEKLINLFRDRLCKSGVVYLAAKTYYFGVGGGVRQFDEAIKKNGTLKSEICWQSSDGIGRKIFKLTLKI